MSENLVQIFLRPPTEVEKVVSRELHESDFFNVLTDIVPAMISISKEKNVPVCGRIDHENYRGTALAAVQIGMPVRVFVARFDYQDPDNVAVIFNPSYSPSGKSVKRRTSLENCLTYRMQSYEVLRYKVIQARYQNHEGQWITMRLKGRDAVLFQQMVDIMDGLTIRTERSDRE